MLKTYVPPIPIVQEIEIPQWEEIVSQGIDARAKKDDAQWELGKLADLVSRKFLTHQEIYGKRVIDMYARDIGVSRKTLERYRRVFRCYGSEPPESHLSYTHYERASRTDKPREWIEQALSNNWSVEQLDREIAISKGIAPESHERTCPNCGFILTD